MESQTIHNIQLLCGPTLTEQMLLQIAELSTWLSSMSLAIVGGIFAAFLQIAFHNASKPDMQIKLKFGYWLTIVLFIESVAIFAGYVARASLLTKIAHFQNLTLVDNQNLGRQAVSFIGFTQIASLVQFLLFMSGVFLIGFFVLRNQHLIGGASLEALKDQEG